MPELVEPPVNLYVSVSIGSLLKTLAQFSLVKFIQPYKQSVMYRLQKINTKTFIIMGAWRSYIPETKAKPRRQRTVQTEDMLEVWDCRKCARLADPDLSGYLLLFLFLTIRREELLPVVAFLSVIYTSLVIPAVWLVATFIRKTSKRGAE